MALTGADLAILGSPIDGHIRMNWPSRYARVALMCGRA